MGRGKENVNILKHAMHLISDHVVLQFMHRDTFQKPILRFHILRQSRNRMFYATFEKRKRERFPEQQLNFRKNENVNAKLMNGNGGPMNRCKK